MRVVLPILFIVLAPVVWAFDSVAWAEKREALSLETERLRVAYSNCLASVTTPASDVTLPVDTFEDGSIKTIVYARKAQYFLETGLIWAEGVLVKKFKPGGELDTRIDAYRCVVDRNSKSGWAEGSARIIHHNTTLKGEGVYFSPAEGFAKILGKSQIVCADLAFGGMKP